MTHTSTHNYGASDAAAIIEVAQAATDPRELDAAKLYGVVLPQGASVQTLDLEKFLPAPRLKKGKVEVSTVDSFEAYALEHVGDGTTVWVHPTSGAIIAVLNDHGKAPGDAAWGDHRAELKLIHTPEWLRWLSLDGQLVDQERFAEHVEDGLVEIVNPDGAELLEIAQTFHATTTAIFRSSKRLSSGAIELTYNEDIEATAGRGEDLEIPATIDLLLRPFIGEEPVELTARLRFRIRDQKLAIGYKLDRPEDVIRDVLDRIAGRLADKFDHVYTGSPR